MPQEPVQPDADRPGGINFENTAFAGWQPFRKLRAAGPGRDVESLRRAYLDLLKLALCDLTGTSTVSVWRDPGGVVMSRELRGDDLQIRALGVDWPLEGLTMVGLHRLDDLEACVESVLMEGVDGDLIEAGTWRGGASILMRAVLDAHGENERAVWVADSFQGFPPPDDQHPDTRGLAETEYVAVPLEEVRANFERLGCERGVEFVQGFFDETMPQLRGRKWSVIRLDGDTYEATWTALQWLYPGLSVGGHVIVDDYGALEECRRAVEEFRARHGISEPLEQVDWTCARWRRTDPSPLDEVEVPGARGTSNGRTPAPQAQHERRRHVPDVHEIALEHQLAERDRELARLREALAAVQGHAGVLSRLRRRLGGRAD